MQVAPPIIQVPALSVVKAEKALIESLERLGNLQVAALTGGQYDPDEYDCAVIAYRHARALAEDARLTWQNARRGSWGYVA